MTSTPDSRRIHTPEEYDSHRLDLRGEGLAMVRQRWIAIWSSRHWFSPSRAAKAARLARGEATRQPATRPSSPPRSKAPRKRRRPGNHAGGSWASQWTPGDAKAAVVRSRRRRGEAGATGKVDPAGLGAQACREDLCPGIYVDTARQWSQCTVLCRLLASRDRVTGTRAIVKLADDGSIRRGSWQPPASSGRRADASHGVR